MGADARISALLVSLLFSIALAQERCSYMTAIPREDRPAELPALSTDGTWTERPLLTSYTEEDESRICMEEFQAFSTTSGFQTIYLEEEIEGEISIARLNYQGTQTPYVGQFLSGARTLLGPEIRSIDGYWHLIITQRQDFETPSMRVYAFDVRVDDMSLVATVLLNIVNIDDNPPIIQVLDACQVPEMGTAPRLTECVYQVSDADGEISTRFMQFQIDSDRGDDEIFYIYSELIPGDWFSMTITIGLNSILDFEVDALHIFQITALDSLPNTHTVTLMVQVENVESRVPRWVEIFAVQQFDEKTTQTFSVRAMDGDTGINRPIYYRIVTDPEDTFFSIETIEGGRSGAILHVSPIDRDYLEREIFQLTIIAYKITDDGEEYSISNNVVIIVNDVNDQIPEPLAAEYFVEILEETPLTINFDQEFGFHDRDLGENAQYTVRLESESPPGAAEAFYIAPQTGYQKQTFIMGTLNHSMLDFEVPEFQHITLRVVATDNDRADFVGTAFLYIDLINWNDELPIFEQQTHRVTFDETEGAGFFVANVRANDRDIDDRVEHTLMGIAGNFLEIDIDTGDIHVSVDDYFDYHRQSELHVQIQAEDTLGEPYNTAIASLVIELIDINNTPPSLRLPRGSPSVEENVPEGYEITSGITATDPDTTAELVFEIDWDTSYATKQGRETPVDEYHNCVRIETIYPDPSNTGSVVGRIVVQEIRFNVTIDFEEFEVLYLTVRVRDLNTVYGDDYDELTFTIIIVDMNDNPPVWSQGTLDQEFRVREGSDTGTVIGSVLATDIDGPLYNQVRYTISPREDTPDGLVNIDFYTGQIDVDANGAIDADTPPRYHLFYTVTASDWCYAEDRDECPPDPSYWNTLGDIEIEIIDRNDKLPQAVTELFDTTVYIYENATSGDEVVTIISSDLDRDVIYHTVRYQINYAVNPRLLAFFSVDLDSGLLSVDYTTNEVLDRDGDEPTHRMFVSLIDNFYSEGDGNRNQIEIEVLVVLLDVNDNAPELPEDLTWSLSENSLAGQSLSPVIYAPDRDEPDTDNSRVGYNIDHLEVTNREDIVDLPDLFDITHDNVTGVLETAIDLRGYWGTYEITIHAYDHGIPRQESFATYPLVIRPYNFYAPEFVFPEHGSSIRLAKDRAVVNWQLYKVDGDLLDRIRATDEDGLHAGQVTFSITGDANAVQYFGIQNDGENSASLILTQELPDSLVDVQITILATDGGTEPGPLSTSSSLNVVLVPTMGDPVFSAETTSHVSFFEGEGGLLESFQLPLAEDAKNYQCVDDCLPIYYRIVVGNEAGHFSLDAETNVLSLATELVREDNPELTLLVAASNVPNSNNAPTSVLTVTVTVREADPRPQFVRALYTAGISTLDAINRELLTVQATHTENAALTYTIDYESMVADPTLTAVQNTAFLLHPTSGVLTLNMQPTAAMQGMFEFFVVATDVEGAFDRTEVKIYLISTLNRVYFIFVNTLQQIEDNRDFIAQTFTTGFGMTCNIDQVVPSSDSNGVALDYLTEIRAHFIQNDVPVPAESIEELRSDTELLRSVQTTLNTELLVLQDFVTDSSPAQGSDAVVTVYVLAVLSAVLGFMCLVLMITFFIRTRALNRRLEALSMTKYGSIDSGLNRAGLAAPNTNKHAVEGSNPIWNELVKAPDFDALSETSGDSDLIGIEDMPQFSQNFSLNSGGADLYDEEPDRYRQELPNHNNNFGFNTSPFSADFTERQFRR